MAIKNVYHGLRYRNPSVKIEVKLDGDWARYRDLINNLDPLISSGALMGQKAAAYKYFNELRRNINNGGLKFGYPPLSKEYKKKKNRLGGEGKMFNWTRSLYNAIEVRFKNFIYSVGIPKGLFKKDVKPGLSNNLPINEYANVIEHGNYKLGVKKRPIFSDTFKSLGGTAFVKTLIVRNIYKKFVFKGIKPNIS